MSDFKFSATIPPAISQEVAQELYRIVHLVARLTTELHDSPLSLQSHLNIGLSRMTEILEMADAGV